MKFLVVCLCLNNIITLYNNILCGATVFDKRKTKLKTSYEDDDTNNLLDYRSPIPLRTQRNIITKILYQLKKGNNYQLPSTHDERDGSDLTPEQKSVINERTEFRNIAENLNSGQVQGEERELENDAHMLRRDYISNLPKPKIDIIDGILNNAVTQIFSKVIPGTSAKKNESFSIAEVGQTASDATAKSKIYSFAKTVKQRDLEKKDVLGSAAKQSNDVRFTDFKGVFNDTLLKEIDAVPLVVASDAVKVQKDVVTNYVKAIDATALNDVGRNSLPNDDDISMSRDPETNKEISGGSFETDDGITAKEVDNSRNKHLDYFFENNKESLTNEDEDDENFVPAIKEVQRPAEKHNLNLFQEDNNNNNNNNNNNAYRKHRVSPSEGARSRSFEEGNVGQDYGTLFIKDTRNAKQLNFYNSDLHLAVTVNSSESRLNTMKAIATVMKELGGLMFEEEDEGVVSKAQFDKLMVDADEEDETMARSGEKVKRPNIPINERQVKITKFKDYTSPYVAHTAEGYDTRNPYTPKFMHPRRLRVGEEEGEDDRDEDAINYYQKNRAKDESERAIDGEERETLIPIGPISEINTKGKIAAIRESGHVLKIKGIRKVEDKKAPVQGDTREIMTDIKTDDSPIPAVIRVGINELSNPKSFEKIFADRVLLAPVIDKKRHEHGKKGHVATKAKSGVANPKKRHMIKKEPRAIRHLIRAKDQGNAILITNDDVGPTNDDNQKLFFDNFNVHSIDSSDDGAIKITNKNNDAAFVASERTRQNGVDENERIRRMCLFNVANSMSKNCGNTEVGLNSLVDDIKHRENVTIS